jgi:hypothetical protein
MRVNSTHGNQTKTAKTRQSVYDGQERLGDVEQRDADFIARDRRGRVIGVFDSESVAVDAIEREAAP